jgi:deoxyadenosine/deoxycytidine kinase
MHIAIAGNIGSGKTTLATLLGKQMDYEVEFEDPASNPYISDFYNDMQRWAFTMQVYFLQARLHTILNIQKSGKKMVQDRTLYEDAEIFAPNLLTMGLMSQRDFDTYQSLYSSLVHLVKAPDLVIYLKASISTLVEQIASREREYEDNIRIDYLKKLNERYDHWFAAYNLGKKLEVNVDELHFKDNKEHLGVIVNRIQGEMFGLFTPKAK